MLMKSTLLGLMALALSTTTSYAVDWGSRTIPPPDHRASYSHQFSGLYGVEPYTFSVTEGALPEGLTLSPEGTISGTPVNWDFDDPDIRTEFTITDAVGDTSSFWHWWVVKPQPVTLKTGGGVSVAKGETTTVDLTNFYISGDLYTPTQGWDIVTTGAPAGVNMFVRDGVATIDATAAHAPSSWTTDISVWSRAGVASVPFEVSVQAEKPVARDLSLDVASTLDDIDFPSLLNDIDFNTHEIVIKSQPSIGALQTSPQHEVYWFNLNGSATDDPAKWASDTSFTYAITDQTSGIESEPATVTLRLPALTRSKDVSISGKAFEMITVNLSDHIDGYTQGFMTYASGGVCSPIQNCGDFQFDYSSGVLTFKPFESGTFTLDYQTTGYFWQSNTSTITFTVEDRPAPTIEAVKNISIPYGSSFDLDLSDLAGGVYDHFRLNSDAGGRAVLDGDVLRYTAPGKDDPFRADDYIYLSVVDSVSDRSAESEVFITLEAPASPTAQSFTVQGDRYKPTVIDYAPHISAGFFDINGANEQSIPEKGYLTEHQMDSVVYVYDAQGLRDAEQITFLYWVFDTYGFTDLATVTINIPAAVVPDLPDLALKGVVGQSFSQAFEATGATAPYSYQLLGDPLPNGMSFNGSILSGTSTEAGTWHFTIRAIDANGEWTEKAYTLEIEPALAMPSMSFNGKVGELMSEAVFIDNGEAPYTLALSGGALPKGVGVNGTKIGGTPTESGHFSFDLTVTDRLGATATASYTMDIAAADANVAQDAQISVQRGGTVTHTFAHDFFAHVSDGDVYAEQLNIKSVSDPRVQLSGQLRPHPTYITVPIASLGTVSIQYSVTDVNGVESNTATLQLQLSDPDFRLDVTESAKPKLGDLYGVTFDVWGAPAPFTYAVTGTWPSEMAWEEEYNRTNEASFTLRGTPTKKGIHTFTITITDANGISKSASHTIDLGADDSGLPIVVSDARTIPYGSSVDIDVAKLITGAFDHIVVHAPEYGSTSVAGNVVTYTAPQKNDPVVATDEFKFSVFTASGDEIQGSIFINLDAPEPPVATSFTLQTPRNQAVEFDLNDYVTAGFFDIASTNVTVLPSVGQLTDLGNGRYRYTPVQGVLPPETVQMQYEARDRFLSRVSASISIEVDGGNTVVAPTAKNGALEVDYGQSGSVDLSKLTTGVVDAISIASAPSKGTVQLNGTTAVYTPSAGETGTDAFSYTVTNAGGSATATITITIKEPLGEVPVAKDHIVRLQPTQSGSVDLTSGAVSKDPILAAHLISSVPATTGSAALAGTRLGFDPYKAFAGSVSMSYQLENRWGKSNVAKVTFMVAERPDPSKDAEVAGLIKAQRDAPVKLNDDQIDNIQRRLEQARSEAAGKRTSSFDWTFGVDRDNPRYDQDGNELDGKNSQNVRGSFDTEDAVAYWTTGYVRVGETEFGGLDLKSTAYGGTAGVDVRFNEHFVGGVALGMGREATKIGSNGTENVAQSVSAALYGTWHNGGDAFIDGILGYSHVSMDSTRYVTPNGLMAYGSRTGNVMFGSLIGGYEFKMDSLKVAPYAGVRAIVGRLNGFTEQGGDIYGLTSGSTDIRSISAVAGLSVEKTIEMENFTVTPLGKLEWRHELAGGSNTALGYTDILSDVGMPYVVRIDPEQRDSVVASLGVRVKPKDMDLSVEANVQANYSGSKPSVTTSVRATWKRCDLFGRVDETACMSREQRVSYFKAELAKAERKKDAKRITELKALLAKAEADLKEWNDRSAQLTPVPDFKFVDTISGKPNLNKRK